MGREILKLGSRCGDSPSGAMQPGDIPTESRGDLDIGALFAAHAPFLGRVIRRYTGSGPHVDDLLQETFIVAFKKRRDFEGRSSVETWLYGIAARLCWRHGRGLRRFDRLRKTLAGREIQHEAEPPGRSLERRDAVAAVHAVLKKLPNKQREVFVLYELEEREGNEIAALLEVPLGTVWTRLHQGRKTFTKLMRRHPPDGDSP